MPYAIVEDVPASWEQYEPLAQELAERVPDGLMLHVAGPTAEGFRTIEIWETREAWERFLPLAASGFRAVGVLQAVPTRRELAAVTAVHGRSAYRFPSS